MKNAIVAGATRNSGPFNRIETEPAGGLVCRWALEIGGAAAFSNAAGRPFGRSRLPR